MRKRLNNRGVFDCWQLVASVWQRVALKWGMPQIIYLRIVIEWANMPTFASKLIYNRIHI